MFGCSGLELRWVSCCVADWTRKEWVWGAYTMPHLSEKLQDRVTAWESLGDRVFFAGEATQKDGSMTVSDAIVTGGDAARQAMRAMQWCPRPARSRL
mmetsp:Transcript_74845/g.175684  ORF Transcript_74845/g.175684 Transcript_74845/m.175684 type:complete len:97 (-) Transcript_74845:68-358(-)